VAQTEKTVSGKVVSSSSSQLVIRTDDGRQMTFNVDSTSTVPAGLRDDARISVRYHELAGGTFHAANVTTTAAPTTTTPETRTDMPQEPATTAAAEPTRELPATASPLPLVGLSGLLALAGGLGARALRRRK
jgi:hypothetical protein